MLHPVNIIKELVVISENPIEEIKSEINISEVPNNNEKSLHTVILVKQNENKFEINKFETEDISQKDPLSIEESSNSEKLKCDYCMNNYFENSSDLNRHIKSFHKLENGIESRAKCGYCFQIFNQTSSLKRHILTVHEGFKSHTCQYCNKSFGQSGIG